MDIQILFQDHAGPDVKYISHERVFRELKIQYKVPRVDPEMVFTIRVMSTGGLHHHTRRAVLRAAERARIRAYLSTGDMHADMENLKQGKLTDGSKKNGPYRGPETDVDAVGEQQH